MDGISQHLQRKFERVLLEAKDAIIETILAGWDRKTPLHFSQIEAASHRLATRWSCCFQEWAAREMTAESPDSAACPTCGGVVRWSWWPVPFSTDGAVPILEWKGTCTRCRRDFFPSAGSDGIGQSGKSEFRAYRGCFRRGPWVKAGRSELLWRNPS